jgi:hypothetical protein
VGQRHCNIRLDGGGLAVSGRGVGPLLAHTCCLGDGEPAYRDAGHRGADHGTRAAPPDRRTAAPLESAQYAALLYREVVARHGITVSMSRRANGWDNGSWKASSIRTKRSSCRIDDRPHGTTRDRTSSSASKCSIIGPAALDARLSLPRRVRDDGDTVLTECHEIEGRSRETFEGETRTDNDLIGKRFRASPSRANPLTAQRLESSCVTVPLRVCSACG